MPTRRAKSVKNGKSTGRPTHKPSQAPTLRPTKRAKSKKGKSTDRPTHKPSQAPTPQPTTRAKSKTRKQSGRPYRCRGRLCNQNRSREHAFDASPSDATGNLLDYDQQMDEYHPLREAVPINEVEQHAVDAKKHVSERKRSRDHDLGTFSGPLISTVEPKKTKRKYIRERYPKSENNQQSIIAVEQAEEEGGKTSVTSVSPTGDSIYSPTFNNPIETATTPLSTNLLNRHNAKESTYNQHLRKRMHQNQST